MNKKGFTLVELLITGSILLIIALITVPNMIGTYKKAKANEYNRFLSDIFLSTEAYVQKNISNYAELKTVGGKVYIYFDELITSGFLKSTTYDPKNKEQVKNQNFTVEVLLTGDLEYEYKLYEYRYNVTEFTYTGDYQEYVVPMTGTYKIELWGAQGGDIRTYIGGKGAYTKGEVLLEKGTTLYIYVGGQGTNTEVGGYNGGANLTSSAYSKYGSSGGGATDIRLTNGTWDNFESLKSRIMVAAGGGGANDRNGGDSNYKYGSGNGGAGGKLTGIDGQTVDYKTTGSIPTYNAHSKGTGGTQILGGKVIQYDASDAVLIEAVTGKFGNGNPDRAVQSGAGSGYYAGGIGSHGGAGGGSSFISGYSGCDAIAEISTASSIIHTGQSEHYSGYLFSNSEMKAGNEEMTSQDGKTTVTGNSGNGFAKISLVKESNEKVLYKENALNGTDPVLGNNMIPVIIENDGTVKKADLYSRWYNYVNKKWANAVILIDESKTYETNEVIPESNIESYFVWIPRYKYKLFNLGSYTSVISSKPTSSIAQSIEIVFEAKDVSASTGNTVGSYITHPAFTTLNANGIWVGKFETGYLGATTSTQAEITNSDATKIIIKPNVYSWRNNTIYNFFVSSYNYKRDLDSHMMKNTEWGAVTYLSHSKYGINKEININNNSSYRTGYSALTTTNQTKYPGVYGDGAAYNSAYNTETGYLASTTGNITGIYDMSGGSIEYMASYKSGTLGSSGFTTTTIANYNSKYFDIYNNTSTDTMFSNRILGDATGEIGPFYNYAEADGTNMNHNNWYADYSTFVDTTSPWFMRGGNYTSGIIAGQFWFNKNVGGINTTISSRLTLTPQ